MRDMSAARTSGGLTSYTRPVAPDFHMPECLCDKHDDVRGFFQMSGFLCCTKITLLSVSICESCRTPKQQNQNQHWPS